MGNKWTMNKGIFIPVLIIMSIILFIGIFFTGEFANVTALLVDYILNTYTGFFLMVGLLAIIVVLFASFSKFGKNIVGGPEAKIEFNNFSWGAMLVCGAIGSSIVYWAVAEPMYHYYDMPSFIGVESLTEEAGVTAIQLTMVSWGVAYSMFTAIWAIAIGYMSMNHGLPLRPSTAFYPLIKENVYRWPGKAIDIFCLIALIGGIVTSFGFGTMQIASGLNFQYGMSINNLLYIGIVFLICFSYVISSAKGLKKGMKVLSDINGYIYIVLLLFLFLAGPTIFLLNLGFEALGETLVSFIPTVTHTSPFSEGGYNSSYTAFYWIWGGVYTPIASLFVLKISKGRTFRQMVIGNFLIFFSFSLFWFTGFGGNAIYLERFFNADIMGIMNAQGGPPISIYALLENMPFIAITAPLLVFTLLISFVTMADAFIGVISSLAAEDSNQMEAPLRLKLFWGFFIGALTLICLFVLGEVGTSALEGMSVVLGLPLFICALIVMISVYKIVTGKVDELKAVEKKTDKAS